MPAFWDASCVLPLVVPAQRSRDAAQLLRAHAPVVWWGTHVEVQSGLARLKQEGALSATACESSRKKLAAMLASWGQIQPGEQVRETALKQLDHFPLRGAMPCNLPPLWCGPSKNRAAEYLW